jgi:hypothetical protein
MMLAYEKFLVGMNNVMVPVADTAVKSVRYDDGSGGNEAI